MQQTVALNSGFAVGWTVLSRRLLRQSWRVGAGLRFWWLGLALLAALLLSGCATPLTTQVSRFNAWPTDAAGSTFSFVRPVDASRELEHASYEAQVRDELERLGLQAAPSGQAGRILVDMALTGRLENRSAVQPIYREAYVYRPGYRDAQGRIHPGFWGPDPWGPRWVGDQVIPITVPVSQLRLRLLDTRDMPGGRSAQPRTVFESTASQEGEDGPLPTLAPFLVRAVFDDFPGQNGRVQVLRFDRKTGEQLKR